MLHLRRRQPLEVGLSPVIELRTLGPSYRDRDHALHVDLILSQLVAKGAEAPRNIAVTGHYGSGKSSILREVERRLSQRRARGLLPPKTRCLNISLSSLGADEAPAGRVTEDGAPSKITNLIQKEIVKQLLYRKPPSKMRGSRYRRTDSFHWPSTAAWSGVVVAVLLGAAVLGGITGRIRTALPADWVARRDWLPWALIGLMLVAGVAILVAALRTLHNRVWIEKLSAGPAAISLQNKQNSYFDEYLDEIVYFFQASKTSVAIFEDLDRFNDPHIFEALRELNTVLNNSEQIGQARIQFVYAIKDSIFEAVGRGHGRRGARAATTDRTKFFDVVVPMVPFITGRSSKEFLLQELGSYADDLDEQLLDLVSPYLTDMRVVKNIRNEYAIFSSRILPPNGLAGLKASQLFAMVIYKNFHMGDFEKLQRGTSKLDKLYVEYRAFVDSAAREAEARRRSARSRMRDLSVGPDEAAELGTRLIAAMTAMYSVQGNAFDPRSVTFKIGEQSFRHDDLSTVAFWRAIGGTNERIRVGDNYGQRQYPRELLAELMDRDLSPERWDESARSHMHREIRDATELIALLEKASISDLIARRDIKIERDGAAETVEDAVKRHFRDTLVIDLIASGYLLDENYSLYASRFEEGSVSLHAMNFILHTVQTRKPDFRFQFDSPADISAIIKIEPRRFLNTEAAYNIEVFDLLLGDERLGAAMRLLATESQTAEDFIGTYLDRGTRPYALIEGLAPIWRGLFAYLARLENRSQAEIDSLVDAALRGARSDVEYQFGDRERQVVQRAIPRSAALTSDGAVASPTELAGVMQAFALEAPRLGDVAQPLRAELIDRGLYPVTADNLVEALGPAVPLRLAAIKQANEAVYRHCLRRLPEYLTVSASVGAPSASRFERLTEVIADVLVAAPDLVREVAERAEVGSMVPELAALDPSTWRDLAAARKFRLTSSNVLDYIRNLGLDDDIGAYLREASAFEAGAIKPEDAAELAVLLANSDLDPSVRARLITSLGVAIDPDLLKPSAAGVVAALVRAGVVPDVPGNYGLLNDAHPRAKVELIRASPRFPDYMTGISLSGDDVTLICTAAGVPDSVRVRLLVNLEQFQDKLDVPAASALTRWAVRHEVLLGRSALQMLAEKGAADADIITGLADNAAAFTIDDYAAVLRALGHGYARIVDGPPGAEVRVPETAQTRTVLTQLREGGRIQSFRKSGAWFKVVV